MTAHVPARAYALRAPVSAAGLRVELDKLAYFTLCFFVFNLPWGEGIPMLGGMVFVVWIGVAACGLTVLRTLVAERARKPSALHAWMLLFVAWSVLSLFWTQDWDMTVTRAGTYVQLMVAVWLIWELARTESRVLGLIQSYVLGALVGSAFTIYNFVIGRTAAQLAGDQGRSVWETSRYTIEGLNENDLGLILALSIPMALYLAASRKGALVKVLCWTQVVAGLTSILLTASRGSLLAAIAGLSMLPLVLFRLPRWQRLAAVWVCLGALLCAAYFVPKTSWVRLEQFGSEISEGTLTHRTTIWAAGMEAFRNHALLGVGSGAYAAAVVRAIDRPLVAHNTFLSVLVELGVVGALVLFGLLASMMYSALRMRYLERCLWFAVLLTWVIGVAALTWEYRKPTWFLFGLLAAHISSRRKQPQAAYGHRRQP